MIYHTKLVKVSLFFLMLCAVLGGLLAFRNTYNTTKHGAAIFCSTSITTCCSQVLQDYTINTIPLGSLSYCTSAYCAPCVTLTYITPLD